VTAKSRAKSALSRFQHELDVTGLRFRWKRDVRRALAGTIRKEDGIVGIRCKREPDNDYDANAIAVYLPTRLLHGRQLGYLRRDAAAVLAPRLDDGSLRIVGVTLAELYAENDWNEGRLVIEFERSA
jgi:hypothetical protein